MKDYIERLISPEIKEAHKYFQVIVMTGPRQSGKSTLCNQLFSDYNYVNMEDITSRTDAMRNPVGYPDSLGKGYHR